MSFATLSSEKSEGALSGSREEMKEEKDIIARDARVKKLGGK